MKIQRRYESFVHLSMGPIMMQKNFLVCSLVLLSSLAAVYGQEDSELPGLKRDFSIDHDRTYLQKALDQGANPFDVAKIMKLTKEYLAKPLDFSHTENLPKVLKIRKFTSEDEGVSGTVKQWDDKHKLYHKGWIAVHWDQYKHYYPNPFPIHWQHATGKNQNKDGSAFMVITSPNRFFLELEQQPLSMLKVFVHKKNFKKYINNDNGERENFLMLYARYGSDPEKLKLLFENFKVKKKNSKKLNAFQIALLYNENKDVVHAFVELVATLKTKDKYLNKPFPDHLPLKYHYNFLGLIFHHRLNKNVSKHTPLTYAAKFRKNDLLKKLLEAGADPQGKNGLGFTPLRYCKGQGKNIVKKFITEQNKVAI